MVWVGYDDNTPIGLSGARAALPIWVEFMKGALAGTEDPGPSTVPEEHVVFVDIDKRHGPAPAAPGHEPQVISEAFIAGTEPHEESSAH